MLSARRSTTKDTSEKAVCLMTSVKTLGVRERWLRDRVDEAAGGFDQWLAVTDHPKVTAVSGLIDRTVPRKP